MSKLAGIISIVGNFVFSSGGLKKLKYASLIEKAVNAGKVAIPYT